MTIVIAAIYIFALVCFLAAAENRFRNFTAGTLFHCHGEILNRGMIPCQH